MADNPYEWFHITDDLGSVLFECVQVSCMNVCLRLDNGLKTGNWIFRLDQFIELADAHNKECHNGQRN